MPQPPANKPSPETPRDNLPTDDSRSWGRFLARTSIMAAMLCCTMNCVLNQWTAKRLEQQIDLARIVVDYGSAAVIATGLACGLAGLVLGLRKKSTDTTIMGCLGLILNGGIVFVVWWGMTVLKNQPVVP